MDKNYLDVESDAPEPEDLNLKAWQAVYMRVFRQYFIDKENGKL